MRTFLKLAVPIQVMVAGYVLLGIAVLGTSHVPRAPHPDTARPPRLFLNGEVARDARTGRKVVVRSAEWDRKCKCYVYTVTRK